MHSVYDEIKYVQSIVPAVYTASQNGSAVDTLGYQSAEFVLAAGTIDLASGNETYSATVEESTDGSTGWAAISGVTGSITANNTTAVMRVDGLGTGSRKRYLRGVLTEGGTTPSLAGTFVALLGRAFQNPVN